MKKAILAVAAVAVLAGCASMERAAGRAADRYCETVTESTQAAIRERLDAATDPHQVRVYCATDEALFLPEGGEHAGL
jgi:type IV pilus biogenesis protein CpaD/CtpE